MIQVFEFRPLKAANSTYACPVRPLDIDENILNSDEKDQNILVMVELLYIIF